MEVFFLLLLIYSQCRFTICTCYIPTVSDKPRSVLSLLPSSSHQRACENECTLNSQCQAIAYASQCVLLGSEITDACPDPSPIFVRQETNCPLRTNISDEMGADPCVNELSPNLLNISSAPLCPRGNIYVIRAVTLDGKRITLDNDQGNRMSFNTAKNAWNFYYSNVMSVWVIAASCTIVAHNSFFFDGSKCPCSPLPLLTETLNGAVNARTDTIGACDNAAFKMRAHHASFPDDEPTGTSNYDPSTMNIRCRAGLWVIQYVGTASNQEGWSIKNATCYP